MSREPRLNVFGPRRSRLQPTRRPLSVRRTRSRRALPESNDAPSTPLTARPLWLAVPQPVATGHPVLVVSAPDLRHGLGLRANAKIATGRATPRFTPLTASGSTSPRQRTGRAAHGPSRVL